MFTSEHLKAMYAESVYVTTFRVRNETSLYLTLGQGGTEVVVSIVNIVSLSKVSFFKPAVTLTLRICVNGYVR